MLLRRVHFENENVCPHIFAAEEAMQKKPARLSAAGKANPNPWMIEGDTH
jgi:hypothetical protein